MRLLDLRELRQCLVADPLNVEAACELGREVQRRGLRSELTMPPAAWSCFMISTLSAPDAGAELVRLAIRYHQPPWLSLQKIADPSHQTGGKKLCVTLGPGVARRYGVPEAVALSLPAKAPGLAAPAIFRAWVFAQSKPVGIMHALCTAWAWTVQDKRRLALSSLRPTAGLVLSVSKMDAIPGAELVSLDDPAETLDAPPRIA